MQYVCSMYAVYMPNLCMKVADIYAVCMLYVCYIVHACILHTSCACMWHVSIFVYICSTHENLALIPEIYFLYKMSSSGIHLSTKMNIIICDAACMQHCSSLHMHVCKMHI